MITLAPNVPVEHWSHQPRYARALIWDSIEEPTEHVILADTTVFLPPLPRPPSNEILNDIALSTIKHNSHLFGITTPINVDRFESLLHSHPNQPLVQSVCTGFRSGFWPRANINNPDITLILDRGRLIRNPEHLAFAFCSSRCCPEASLE